jgi:hypothetical protein
LIGVKTASQTPPLFDHLNSTHILGTHVPVEEPSTASKTDICSPSLTTGKVHVWQY